MRPAVAVRRVDWAVERLLHGHRPHRARRLEARERRVQGSYAAVFLAAAMALALVTPTDRALSPGTALALVAAYAVASRVRLYVGAGYAMPTQLVLVPMLFWLPVASVPLLVAAGLVLAVLPGILLGSVHPERALTAVADAAYALGPAVVLAAAGEPAAGAVSWTVVALAFAAQCGLDLLGSMGREWLGRGIPPALQVRVIVSVYLIDACLTPVAVLAAAQGRLDAVAIAAALPLLVLLAAFAHDRRERIDELTSRLDELEAERRRVDATIRRVGEASGAGLDRPALLDLLLRTAVDAVRAERGRARAGESEAVAGGRGDAAAERAMDHAARAAGRRRRMALSEHDGAAAIAHPLAGDAVGDVVVVARAGAGFAAEEAALFSYLAGQMAIAMENVALHERISREARIDELTGLANHRHFQESLALESDRMRRFRRPLGLAMIDIDHFKSVNDTHGHQQGDEVLRAVAGALRDASRRTDLPARYGGEEFAVVLPDTDLEGAYVAGEHVRRSVEALQVPRPGGAALQVTVSVGVAAAAGPASGAELIAAADAALYEAKRSGRNRTVRAGGQPAARFAR